MNKHQPLSTLLAVVAITFVGCASPQADSYHELPQVEMATRLGSILIEVDTLAAPITATNFLRYVDEGRLDSAHFYRVVTLENQPNDSIRIEVVQGGLGNRNRDKRLPSIPHETTEQTGLLHTAGAISMARLDPGSASSEFFICVTDQPQLDFGGIRNPDGQGFAAFGRVVDGMDIIKLIQESPTRGQALADPIEITAVHRVTNR